MTTKYRLEVQDNPEHDSKDFWIYPVEGSSGEKHWTGHGYINREDGTMHLEHCPECDSENYMAQTMCVSCGFNPNIEFKEYKNEKTI